MRAAIFALFLLTGLAHAGPEDSAVQVRHFAGGSIGSGSGTVVWMGGGVSFVLTNHHVAPDCGRKVEVTLAGQTYPAEWLRSDAGIDLALLRVKAELPAADVADEPPARGTVLRQWGHSRGGPQKPKAGPAIGVDGRRAVPGGGQVYATGIHSEPGDSGSGVFDPAGRLVAVCWGGGQGRECCVKLADVKAFLWPK
jgi:serine protease Do